MLELWGTKIERELASLEWVVTPGGGKYHVHDCNHVKGNGRKYLPCKRLCPWGHTGRDRIVPANHSVMSHVPMEQSA